MTQPINIEKSNISSFPAEIYKICNNTSIYLAVTFFFYGKLYFTLNNTLTSDENSENFSSYGK